MFKKIIDVILKGIEWIVTIVGVGALIMITFVTPCALVILGIRRCGEMEQFEQDISQDNFIVLNTKELSKIRPFVESTIIYDPETLVMYSMVDSGKGTTLLPLLDEDGNLRKYNDADDKENNLVILSLQEISSHSVYTIFDPETSVMYNIVYGYDSSKVTPMYNADGSVKLYNKKAIKSSRSEKVTSIKEDKKTEDVKSDKESVKPIENKESKNTKETKKAENIKSNKEGRKIKEYKEVEEIEGTKKIKTVTEIEEYKEVKKSKLNKILDNIKNMLD